MGPRFPTRSDGLRSYELDLLAGRHLYHVAVKNGEAREQASGGWFTAPQRSWLLPPQLLPLARVRVRHCVVRCVVTAACCRAHAVPLVLP